MNCFFYTIAEKLNAGQLQAPHLLTSPCSKPVPCISDIYLSSLDIDRKITLLKNNKATGPDGISPKLLKLAGTAVVGPLTCLFMQSIRECSVYNSWKVARLTPVFKKDDPTVVSNYRPLSLLSVPSKILESCVADMIAKYVFSENEALVTGNQWAYRKGRSTELLLFHLTETWRRAIDNKLVVGAVFIILGDPGADSGDEEKSKWAEKYMARRKVKNGEKSPWGQCLTRPVPNGRRRSGF